MPYKFNETRRQKIPKARYRVTNWPEYDAALVRRYDSLRNLWRHGTLLPPENAVVSRSIRRLQSKTGLALRLVFHQPLRQTDGMLRSIVETLKINIAVPDHTTLSRRGGGMTILPKLADQTSRCIFSSIAPA